MSNVLLVDTNFSSGPIYHYLVKAGHNVHVVGGNPKDALAKCVENYVHFDYTDLEMTRQLIVDRNIEYVVPGCNDRSYLVCAELNHDGRFPGVDVLETAATINNKEKFRRFAVNHGLPVPNVLLEEEVGTRWPVIVKPVDAYSGRGVSVIHGSEKNELAPAVARAREFSRTNTCIVEDFVEGKLYSHTAFISMGQILADHIVEEYGSANRFVVDTSRVRYDFPETMRENIRENLRILARELRLKDGLIHTQFIRNGDDYWLIEITRRCPGDLYSQLIELSTGSNYVENYVRPFVNMPLSIRANNQKKWIMRHTISLPNDHVLGSISFNWPLTITKLVPIGVTGDRVMASPYGRIAILFAETNTEKELEILFNKAINRELYQVFA